MRDTNTWTDAAGPCGIRSRLWCWISCLDFFFVFTLLIFYAFWFFFPQLMAKGYSSKSLYYSSSLSSLSEQSFVWLPKASQLTLKPVSLPVTAPTSDLCEAKARPNKRALRWIVAAKEARGLSRSVRHKLLTPARFQPQLKGFGGMDLD